MDDENLQSTWQSLAPSNLPGRAWRASSAIAISAASRSRKNNGLALRDSRAFFVQFFFSKPT